MTNHWDERFKDERYMYGKEPNAFVEEKGSELPKGRVLCIAEGEGRNAVYLAKLGYDVTAWDYAQSGLDKTKRLAKEHGVEVETALHDLADVKWEEEKEQWDAIVHVFGHFDRDVQRRTLEGVREALKPGGIYLSELYSEEQLAYKTGGPGHVDFLYDPSMILDIFKDDFMHHFFIGEVHRKEGVLHDGLSHVVQTMVEKR